jgi:hypothetical protein
MPNMNGMGPQGQGSKTGRGLGKCNEESDKGSIRPYGRERGRGRGIGEKFNHDSQDS